VILEHLGMQSSWRLASSLMLSGVPAVTEQNV
jgi:hypothetical protein